MKIGAQLRSVGIPLVILPVAALALVFALYAGRDARTASARVLQAQSRLLASRASAARDTLVSVGLDDSAYYRKTTADLLIDYFHKVAEPNQSVAIVDEHGIAIARSGASGGIRLSVSDELSAFVSRSPTVGYIKTSGFDLKMRAFFAASTLFEPWNWRIVVAQDRESLLSASFEAFIAACLVAAAFAALAAFVFDLMTRRIVRPLLHLQEQARAMAEGRMDARATIEGPEEVRELARQFNSMADRVSESTRNLESHVSLRTAALSESLQHLRQAQDTLVQTEKLAALGSLVAEIAHELNTPLGAISSANRSLIESADRSVRELPALYAGFKPAERELFDRLGEHASAVDDSFDPARARAARRAIRGLLAEHGVEDPDDVADLLADAEIGTDSLSSQDADTFSGESGHDLARGVYALSIVRRSGAIIASASAHAARIIQALRIYAGADGSGEHVLVDVAESIDSALTLMEGKLRAGIELVRDFNPVPRIRAAPERLAQVWVNLLSNALQAMDYSGRLEIRVSHESGLVVASFKNSGPEVPAEIRDRIFEPFYTTKRPGEGSGLGLPICRQVAQEHGGTIDFKSDPAGTTFAVSLPVAPEGTP